MTKFLKDGSISEHHIQKTVMDWVKLHPTIRDYIFSIPNESAGTGSYGKKLKARGLRPGASDLFVALARHNYHGCFLELKSANGRLSSAQIKFISDMEKVGYICTVCFGIDETIGFLKWYCFE